MVPILVLWCLSQGLISCIAAASPHETNNAISKGSRKLMPAERPLELNCTLDPHTVCGGGFDYVGQLSACAMRKVKPAEYTCSGGFILSSEGNGNRLCAKIERAEVVHHCTKGYVLEQDERSGRPQCTWSGRQGPCNECDEPVKSPAYINCDSPAFPFMEPDGTELCYLLISEAPTPVCFPPHVASGDMCENGTTRLPPVVFTCSEGFTLTRDMRCIKEVYTEHGYICPKGYYLDKSQNTCKKPKIREPVAFCSSPDANLTEDGLFCSYVRKRKDARAYCEPPFKLEGGECAALVQIAEPRVECWYDDFSLTPEGKCTGPCPHGNNDHDHSQWLSNLLSSIQGPGDNNPAGEPQP